MEKFEKVIEEKKIKSSTLVPKYGMRKLSVGLVSCALGFSILGITDTVQAQEAGLTDTAQVQEAEIKDTSQDIEATDEIVEAVEISSDEKNQVEDKVQAVETDYAQVGGEVQSVQEVQSIQKEVDVAQAEENLEIEEEKTPQAQKAGETQLQKETDPNYSEDEKKIEDYSKDERYRETDLQPGDTNQEIYITDQEEAKDGLDFNIKNPSATSTSKTEYGYQITIDKKTGQRTYTKLYVTDSGLIPVDPGKKPMMGQGDKLTPESPGVTYKPDENTIIDASRAQRNLNYEASEETLKHINNSDNDSTSFGMQDNYTQENPGVKFFGKNFALGYKVNPWPNENDKLEELKLNKNDYDPTSKYFVQGQDIDTRVKVDNIDENAKERLVGQVYNPITGDIVPGASAYIDDQGSIHIQMPEGALIKNEDGKYVVNKKSIFSNGDYKALQNLDVKFFARPRTAEEFRKIAETPDDFGATGTYVETGAGTAEINHKGTNVTIDKQGIDRYDHYNLIGDFKLNLDDTRYYNQNFKDDNDVDTSEITSSAVTPGVEFEVGIYEKKNPGEYDKSADDMNGAESRGEAAGILKMDFINKLNEGRPEGDQWKVKLTDGDITKFTITPPASAKAGDFAAIPVEYTYTNGSTDVHWFHFVVKESDNNLPSYNVQVDYPSEEMNSTVTVEQNDKKNKPNKYTIDSNTYTDNQGNTWDVAINEETGEVTAKPQAKLDGKTFNGGEKLQVPVTVHYEDTNETETAFAEFVLKEKSNLEPDYDAKAGKAGDKLESDVIVDDNNYDRKPVKYTIDQTEYTDNKGNKWTVSIDPDTGKVTANVPNAADGETIDLDGTMINVPVTAHYQDADGNDAGTKKANVQFLGSGTQGTHEYTEKLPFKTRVEVVDDLAPGEWRYKIDENGKELKGELGSKTTKWAIKDSVIQENPEITEKAPVDAVIEIGNADYTGKVTHTEKIETPFEVEYQYSDELEAGETKVIQKGEKGSYDLIYSQNIKNGQADGDAKTDKTNVKEAKKEIIVIGIKPVEKVVEKGYNTEYIYDDTLEAGKIEEETPGQNGKTTITTSYDKENNKLVTEEKNEEPTNRVVRVGIKPIEEETELPFETEYVYDENMEAGKTEVTQEGKEGKAKITTSFNKETGKLETKVEREEPTKKIVKYGSKTEGKVIVKSDIPYEVEIIEDPDMEAGKTELVQEGKKGVKETTVTIKNSEEVSREDKTTTEPTKKIIKVGTKNVCEIPTPDPEKPEKPVDPEEPETPETPDNPGITEDPEKPNKPDTSEKHEKPEEPEEPGKPGQENPGKPEEPGKPNIPGKPGEEKPSDPTTPGQTPDKSESKDSEKVENTDSKIVETEKEKDPQTKEEVSIEEKTSQKVEKDTVKKVSSTDDSRAPQTFDPGVASYLGLGGMTSTVLAYLEYKKRKNKKNK